MANSLTGDFEAVLQVSGATINRLVASLHQNASTKPHLPSFPHSINIRIGDDYCLDGVRGRVEGQLGAPRITLVIDTMDVVGLEVDVRVRYVADPGSTPLPEFIHGKVTARYRIQPIDRACPGWEWAARDYLWIRVEPDTVRFDGTAEDEFDLNVFSIPDPAETSAINTLIRKQISHLLVTRFGAAPHRVNRRFRLGAMRSLRSGPFTAVAMPLSLSGGDPAGHVTSLNKIVVAGSDFAVAVSTEFLMAQLEPKLRAIRAFTVSATTKVSPPVGPDWYIHHTARVTQATATWETTSGMSGAVVHITVDGVVDSDSSWAPAISFKVDQPLYVTFKATIATLSISAGEPAVQVNVSSSGVGSLFIDEQQLADMVEDAIRQAVKAQTQGLPSVSVESGRTALVEQLRTIDDQADARFTHSDWTPPGAVLYGRVSLTPRITPTWDFARTPAEDGFTALESWVPGGRIDSFDWSWTWDTGATDGPATRKNTFLLRRPYNLDTGTPAYGTKKHLPGLNGNGKVCLKIRGVYTDPVSGDLVNFSVAERCTRFGIHVPIDPSDTGDKRPLQRLWSAVERPDAAEIGLVDISAPPVEAVAGANTLIVHFGEQFDRQTADALAGGLAASRRHDAGVCILALFDANVLERQRTWLFPEVQEFAQQVRVPVHPLGDVEGFWSYRLAIGPEGIAWRLLSPDGCLAWLHNGPIEAERLAQELDTFLWTSPPPRPVAIESKVRVGSRVPPFLFNHPLLSARERQCPPQPLGALGLHAEPDADPSWPPPFDPYEPPVPVEPDEGDGYPGFPRSGLVVTFLHPTAQSSHAQLVGITRRYTARSAQSPRVCVVVHGLDRQAQALGKLTHPDAVLLPDPAGALARRLGVRMWPTTIHINAEGIVTDVLQGLHDLEAAHPPREHHFRGKGEAQ